LLSPKATAISILPALAEAAEAIELDWVQYKRNFRAPVVVRPFGRDQTSINERPPLLFRGCGRLGALEHVG
jgi:hypothetical protein